MPTCDARYDVTLWDGQCGHWMHGSAPMVRGVLDYAEERDPDEFGDPGPLLAARFLAGQTTQGEPVSQPRKGRFMVGRISPLHWVNSYERRYLRWHWAEPDPPPHDDPEWINPP